MSRMHRNIRWFTRLHLTFMAACIALITATAGGTAGIAAQSAPPASDPALLSAFFGLDNALPFGANGLCRRAAGQDGMPVILGAVIDPATLDAADFAVTTAAGVVSTPSCATLSPAVDAGELRTVLLIGEFGSAVDDPPARVEVVGDILTAAGVGANPDAADANSLNFKGAAVEVIPLDAGPTLIVAEAVPQTQWALDQAAGRQQGTGCPSARTLQIVRATWAGGVTVASGDEAGDAERALYRVNLRQTDGSTIEVTPFALADVGDGDNNHLLCLDVRGEPVSVTFPAGQLYDPNHDVPNPETSVAVELLPGSQPLNYRDVRYCEVVPTYRQGLRLRTEIWNTLGLNDCPADEWAALDAAALQADLGAVNLRLNGPRYWVLDEIGALGGVTASGESQTFGTLETVLRAVLETNIRGDLVGTEAYATMTVQRDTRYVFYAGELIYTLTDPDGNRYVMQSYAQIIDPDLTIDDLTDLADRLTLPEGWTYAAIRLDADLILISFGETTIVQDDLLNTYQLGK